MKPIAIIPRLWLSYLFVAVLPLAGISLFSLASFERALRETVLEHLATLADKKANQIDTFMNERLADVRVLASGRLATEAIAAFARAYHDGGIDSAAYRAAEADLGDKLREFGGANDYWDLLLMDTRGNVVFTLARETDLGTNLRDGPFRATELAKGFDLAMNGPHTHLTRFAPYTPSKNRVAAFLVAPVLKDGVLQGAVALQVNLDRLETVVEDRTGLGKSGETVLALRDGDELLITSSLKHVPNAAFRHRIPLERARALPLGKVMEGNNGHALARDYAGVEVVAAWRYLPALRWGMVVKIDAEEALAPATELRRVSYALFILFLLLSSGAAYVLGRRLSAPILNLAQVAEGIAAGDLSRRARIEGGEELGRLAKAFNTMTEALGEARQDLEARVAARTGELHIATRRLVEAQHTAHIGGWELDLGSGRLYWSDEIFNIFEIDPARFPASYEGFLNAIHPEDREAVNQAYTDSLAKREPYEIAHRLSMPDGRVKWVQERCRTDFDAQGKPLRSTGTVQDITQAKEAEALLREREERLRAIMDNANAVIFMKDLEGRYLHINSRYEQLFHVRPEDLQGKTDYDIHPPEIAAELIRNDQAVVAAGAPIEREEQVMQDDGPHHYLAVKFPLRDEAGRIHAVCGIATDITERKLAETRLTEANRELLAAKERAEAANRVKSEFLANMNHEIRTPMNAIIGLTGLALEGEPQPREEGYLRKVMSSSLSLLGILNDILDYSKIEAGHMSIERIPLRVEDIPRKTLELFSARAEEKGLELRFAIAPEVPAEVMGDPLRIAQVLGNLVGNAIKFTEHGGIDIQVGLEPSGAGLMLRFAVRDSGIGIDPARAEHLFHPFTQADGTVTRKYGGTGLGLSICKKLVTLMGGDISARGVPGEGSTFTFTVLVGQAGANAPDAGLPEPAPSLEDGTTDAPPDAARCLALGELLGRLIPYIEEGELIPDEHMHALRQQAGHDLPRKPLTRLLHKIDHFDHDGALAEIARLAEALNLQLKR